MKEQLVEIKQKIEQQINQIQDLNDLQLLRSSALGKKSELQGLMIHLKDLPNDEKPMVGKLINETKQALELIFDERKGVLEEKALNEKLEKEQVDVTLPGLKLVTGSTHLLTQVQEDIEQFFIGLGYEIKDGPEVESDHYNFEMLNLEKDHPARAMQDSFYIDVNRLLRTHTSPVQARTMLESEGKNIKIICPGKVYRRDDDDQTHSHQFMQIEGLVIGESVSFADLKGTLLAVIRHFFGSERTIRLRPSYFPFTEPSVEVDVFSEDGRFIEVLGAGMVHPNVLKMGGYDPQKVQGFAFGIGIERLAILKYAVDDIRQFYTNDVRFLNQFKGGLEK
ncbi:Phenylalanyl-tRNA synthetase, alpha chain [Paracholeplasma brassicae]|uniref:Phenylalanine--tRNA ligase alpha subunit n=1 Tax=Acholeplasma brassicae TaxID=61635 RepID=U4KMX9_9MOLU|nr:phenylalanine--tRNA ligase subunit alpha [Paracholeplasma brassicae]CCV65536.1 Phenylalanyl-tRNA synthetase, alpha chain [Paracholeplasma brassicae]